VSYSVGPTLASPQTRAAAARSTQTRMPHEAMPGNQTTLRRLQAKLAVGAVDDPLEHEADAVAAHVMRMPDPARVAQWSPPRISRKCAACEEEPVRRKCAACEEEEKLQAKRGDSSIDGEQAPASVDETLRSSGQALDAGLRGFFEPRFGADFSGIRVHSDPVAARSARDVGARAYAVGNHLVFGAGNFAPESPGGRELLAHELTHTVQQGAALRREPEAPEAGPAPTPAAAAPADPASAPAPATGNRATCLVHFVKGSTEFTDAKEFAACMASIKSYLAADPARVVELNGFASEEGTADFNQTLAQKRADTVKGLLVTGGVDAAKLTATGHGPDTTYAKLEDNRRVEVLHRGPGPVPPPQPETPGPKKKGICGPVVTKQLTNGMNNVRTTFTGLPPEKREDMCSQLFDSIHGLVTWDFTRLHVRNWMEHQKCATILGSPNEACCANSVQINDQCYYAGSPNYVLFGGMCKLCFDHYVAKEGNNLGDIEGFTSKRMLSLIELYKSDAKNFGNSQAWALAGYNGWPGGGTPPSGDCADDCATSCGPFFIPGAADNDAFRARWCPHIDPLHACQSKAANAADLAKIAAGKARDKGGQVIDNTRSKGEPDAP